MLLTFQSVFMKSRKVRDTTRLLKMADGIYQKLSIFNRSVQKETDRKLYYSNGKGVIKTCLLQDHI